MLKKSGKKNIPSVRTSMTPSINIRKAENGFTVSQYTEKGDEIRIATSMRQAIKHAEEMLNKA